MALDEVRYGSKPLNVTSSNGLESGDFMQKWLALELIEFEVDGRVGYCCECGLI